MSISIPILVLLFPTAAVPLAPVQGGASDTHLAQLHLHGSLSEGTASMQHHVDEAEQAGYDVLWWADHMERQFASLYAHSMDFEGTLSEVRENGALNEFLTEEDAPGFLRLRYTSSNPISGAEAVRLQVEADPGTDWTEARLVYHSVAHLERSSLLAEPEASFEVRLQGDEGDAGFLVRLELSSHPDGVTEQGTPNVLEYLPAGLDAPAPGPNVRRIELQHLDLDQWVSFVLDPAGDARGLFPLGDDQTLHRLTFVLLARDGGEIELDLDAFELSLRGKTDLDLFRQQEAILAARYSQELTHHVGMEVAGPYLKTQPVQAHSTRDHIVALYPGGIPALIDFHDPVNQFTHYPDNGVQLIQQAGGVAVVAHIFGARMPCAQQELRDAYFLARRLARQKAFGADAVEIGYPFRERELADHLAAWDYLSFSRVYVTGVASSDDHNVLGWENVQNRWGSWLQADDDTAPSLLDAVRRGKVFFGDPFVFDPEGTLLLEAADGSYAMGNVVPIAAGKETLHARVDGARSGDALVAFLNGREIHREAFTAALLDTTFEADVLPGDYLRIEVRDPLDEPYLVSNPIYYLEESATPPPHRTPGS